MTRSRDLLAAALVGAASGGRAGTGGAALTFTARDHAIRQPDRTLHRPLVRAVVGAGAAVEYVGDKLPSAPSRLEPGGLGARVVAAASCGVIVARRNPGASAVACAAVAASAAATTSWLGAQWRRWAASRLGGDLPGAFLEDAAVITSAVTGARLAS